MIAGLALRGGPSSLAAGGARAAVARRRRSQAQRSARPAPAQPKALARSQSRPRMANLTWEVRRFVAAAAAIAAGVALALLYLSGVSGLAAGGYETERLDAARAEAQRQVALLEVRLARLESPARVELEAARLGLVRMPHIAVISAQELAAKK